MSSILFPACTRNRKMYLARKYVCHRFSKGGSSWLDSKQHEDLCWTIRSRGSLKQVLWEISQNSQENISSRIYFLAFSCKFCEICQNTVFAEQHRKTVSDYTSINTVGKGALGNKTVNYGAKAKSYVFIWARSVNY